jgi:predicted Zn-dependent protease
MLAALLFALTFEQALQQANAARDANRVDDAIKLYREAVRLKPAASEAWWYLGVLLYERDDYRNAEPAFEKLTAMEPRGGQGWAMLGLCEFRNSAYDEALGHLHRGRTLGLGGNEELERVARYHQAILSNRAGQFELAMALLTEFAREGADQPRIIEATGIAALRLATLPADLQAEKKEIVMMAGKAAFAGNSRRIDEARRETEALVAKYPEHPNVHYMKAVLLLQEQNDHAFAEFEKELAISPDHVPSRMQIAIEYLQRGQAEKALPRAAEAAQLAPNNFATRTIYGRALLESGKPAAAIPELEAAVRLAPESPEAHFALGNAYSRVGRKMDAQRERDVFQKLRRAQEQSRVSK